jgi:hypothetical protein
VGNENSLGDKIRMDSKNSLGTKNRVDSKNIPGGTEKRVGNKNSLGTKNKVDNRVDNKNSHGVPRKEWAMRTAWVTEENGQ